jgi:SAM-dependent methyltransferase
MSDHGASPSPRSERGFADLDGSADHERLFAMLESASAHPAVRAYKEASFRALRLGPGARVLEVGCGLGDDAAQLATRVAPGGCVVAVDASARALERARARHADAAVDFRRGDIFALAAIGGDFDAVRVDRVLHFLTRPEAALAELVRALRAGGRLALCESDRVSLAIDAGAPELTARLLAYNQYGVLPTCISGRHLLRLCRDAGLADVEVEAYAGVVTELALADRLFSLSHLVRSAVLDAVLDAHDAARWWAAAEADARSGRFFAAMTMVLVSARRPEAAP